MIHRSKTRVGFGTILGLAVLSGPPTAPPASAGSSVADEESVPTAAAVLEFDFEALPPLPGGEGFAGAIAGLDGRHLIVAGGANFPESPRWETPKVWHDDAHVLDLTRPEIGWRTFENALPSSVAYGVSIGHPALGVVSIGGDTGQGITDRVVALRFDEATGDVTSSDLPPLPEPRAYAAGGLVGGDLFVFGGRSTLDGPALKTGWRLATDAEEPAWKPIAPIPGPARILPVAGVLRNQLYCFSGVALEPGEDEGHRRVSPYLVDAWRYDPTGDVWSRIEDLPRPAAAAASPAIVVGWDMLAVVGGDDGTLLDRVASLRDDHPGFPTDVLVYHPITDRWTRRGDHPVDRDDRISPAVTTTTIAIAGTDTGFDGRSLIAGGEIRPRTRTPRLVLVEDLVVPATLGWADWTAIAAYGGVLVWMGIFFSRREDSTDEYFLAGRRIPWWASGISIFATSLSAITFMAIPAKTWDTDWTYILQNLLILVVAPIAAMLLVPAFRRLDVTTAYEYLEHRFHASLRLAASAMYMLFQVGRVAVVTLLPALALAAVTGLDVTTCILVMGVICILYTVLGGIEAVIWSDVLQAAVLFGGAGWALAIMLLGTDGGLTGLVEDAGRAGKLRAVDVSADLTRASLLVIVLGGIFSNIIPYASDQSVVQRYLAVKDVKEAKRAVWAGAFLALPASLLFFGLGTALWGFYRSNPEVLRPTEQLDQILPLFIVDMLPTGVAGIVLAGLFAAAMSSLDSSMNSVSTAFTTDWYRRFRPDADDRHRLRIARIATVTIGVLGTTAAIVMARLNNSSLLDLWFEVLGLFGSGIAGVFLLGALTRRTGPVAGWVGLVCSAIAVWSVGFFTDLSGLAFAAVGILTCLVMGVLTGMVEPKRGPRPSVE
ncbi:MAG: sodium/solute symporter [Planctomycetota bacterium]|nr:sodium/solute symporter [Planctomycetota bacterium]